MPSVKKVAQVSAAAAAIGGAVYGATYIDADGGGSVYEYAKKYDDMYARGQKVVIRGNCYSSCTMALGYPNACLEQTAVLGFHPAYTPWVFGFLHYTLSPQYTQVMREHYPPDALEVINRHDGLKDNGGWFRPKITLINASEFPDRYRCT